MPFIDGEDSEVRQGDLAIISMIVRRAQLVIDRDEQDTPGTGVYRYLISSNTHKEALGKHREAGLYPMSQDGVLDRYKSLLTRLRDEGIIAPEENSKTGVFEDPNGYYSLHISEPDMASLKTHCSRERATWVR